MTSLCVVLNVLTEVWFGDVTFIGPETGRGSLCAACPAGALQHNVMNLTSCSDVDGVAAVSVFGFTPVNSAVARFDSRYVAYRA